MSFTRCCISRIYLFVSLKDSILSWFHFKNQTNNTAIIMLPIKKILLIITSFFCSILDVFAFKLLRSFNDFRATDFLVCDFASFSISQTFYTTHTRQQLQGIGGNSKEFRIPYIQTHVRQYHVFHALRIRNNRRLMFSCYINFFHF